MFNIGFAELLLVLIIAYVIVGPKDLPKVARWLGRMVRTARQLIRELKAEVGWDEMMAETSDIAGFAAYLDRYRKALPVERKAVEVL